jgi:PAS domain S-box-containing protein
MNVNRGLSMETVWQSDLKFRLLVENVKDYAIFMLDRRGIVKSWSIGAEKLKQYKASEILGEHFSKFYLPEDIAAGKPAHSLELAAKQGRVEEEFWRVRKDGSHFWADVVITAIRDREDGELLGYAKVTRDLTEKKLVEERDIAAAKMIRDVEAQDGAKQCALAAAAESSRLKSEFLANMAHEIRCVFVHYSCLPRWGTLCHACSALILKHMIL